MCVWYLAVHCKLRIVQKDGTASLTENDIGCDYAFAIAMYHAFHE